MQSVNHYENFPVASVLCPPPLRPPIQAIYHFARTADDLADEGDASPDARLTALQTLRQDLLQSLEEAEFTSPQWPHMLKALRGQVKAFDLPVPLLLDLLDAFSQDVDYTRQARRYASRAELLDYCRRSANPIGRLLLHLYGVNDAASLQQSDAVCSALQLINFWQDLSEDVPRGRHYLPENADLQEEMAFAKALMLQGAPLVHRVPGRAGWELRLVVQGGLRILEKSQAMDTRLHRPQIKATDLMLMAWRACWMPQSRA
jgi:hydroxysqualene synthase